MSTGRVARLQIRNRQWLINARLEAGLSQPELAAKAKVSHSIVAKLEQGARERVDPSTARGLCKALSCEVTHLFRAPERLAS
jgi:transcriptional regulator with XRE-family HTH domain